jgi:hypothetical protein
VVTPLLELDIYCTLEDDTIANVAEDYEVEVSDVLTFSTHFIAAWGHTFHPSPGVRWTKRPC